MNADRRRLEQELTEAFDAGRDALADYLRRAFPRLASHADDILQDAFMETLRRVRREGFSPRTDWFAWLRLVARNRAVDRLRAWERRAFGRLASSDRSDNASRSEGDLPGAAAPVDSAPGPATELAEAERRARQGLLLSHVLEQFCRWCEARPARALAKEAYERSLRGQTPQEIAAAMQLRPAQVYDHLNRARAWVFERIRQADVDRSVFLTLHRRKPE